MTDIPEFYARDRAAWRAWLTKYHATERAVWLVFDKGPDRPMQWEDIVQEALCFGWVDSKGGMVSDTQSKIYISRRNPKSAWSKINKAHVEQLMAARLMAPAGLAAVEDAKRSGTWNALDKVDNMVMPPELTAALAADPAAGEKFAGFSDSSKRIILQWIYSAKRPETYTKHIEETVRLAHDGIKANHYRQ